MSDRVRIQSNTRILKVFFFGIVVLLSFSCRKRGCMDDTAVNYDADAVVPIHCVFTTMLPNTKLDGTCLDGYIIGSGQEFDARNDIDKFTIFWLQNTLLKNPNFS